MKRALPIAIAMFLSGMVSYALSRLDHPPAPTPAPASTPVAAAPAPTSTPEDPVLARLDARIATYRQRAEARGDDWLEWELMAINAMDRARVTGAYEDWALAERALDSGFRVAVPGAGPFLSRAILNSAMHRIERVEPDLAMEERSLMLSENDRLAILSLRADARFYGGDYAAARTLYEQQLSETERDPASLVAMAQLDWRTGHFDDAAALFDEALAQPAASAERGAATRAWVLSARAMMERDRGRLEDALTAIRAARGLSPADTHLDQIFAEILELRGTGDAALDVYRDIATRTGSPQAMDGAARLLRARGETIAETELVASARQSYEAQMALFPEAAYGHAIDHWLRLEPGDVDRMLTIARGNAEARPYGEPRVKLAMAYVLAGRLDEARSELDAVRATEWDTAELHAVSAIVLAREGADASAERAAAEAIAPGAMDRLAWLAQ